MSSINILNKVGYLTKEDRKEKLVRGCDHFTFHSCLDLSDGVLVVPYGDGREFTIEQYSRDLASFVSFWNNFVAKDLNGFSGFQNVKFNLYGFKIIS